MEEEVKMERHRRLLQDQVDGKEKELDDFPTQDSSQHRADVYSVDLDGLIKDIEKMEEVNYLPHDRDHVDYRLVWTKRLGTNIIRPSGPIQKK
jgi:hypothetical protein